MSVVCVCYGTCIPAPPLSKAKATNRQQRPELNKARLTSISAGLTGYRQFPKEKTQTNSFQRKEDNRPSTSLLAPKSTISQKQTHKGSAGKNKDTTATKQCLRWLLELPCNAQPSHYGKNTNCNHPRADN
jgi:hypothetical protein